MTLQTKSFKLPFHWASYLTNSISSGLSPQEKNMADSWLKDQFSGFTICTHVEEGASFSWNHDALDYLGPCEVSKFTFVAT